MSWSWRGEDEKGAILTEEKLSSKEKMVACAKVYVMVLTLMTSNFWNARVRKDSRLKRAE